MVGTHAHKDAPGREIFVADGAEFLLGLVVGSLPSLVAYASGGCRGERHRGVDR